jgi:hypothetical protein
VLLIFICFWALDIVLQGACPVPAAEDAGAPMKQREAPAAPPLTANDVTDLATFNKRLQRVSPRVHMTHPSLPPLSLSLALSRSLSLSLSVCVCVCVCVFLPVLSLSLSLCPTRCSLFFSVPPSVPLFACTFLLCQTTWANFLLMIDFKPKSGFSGLVRRSRPFH